MRFLIFGVFLTGWCTMWTWTYTCHIKRACCPGLFAHEIQSPPRAGDLLEPVAFRIGGDEPVTGTRFPFYRDSLIAKLDSGKVLEITGLFTDQESQELGATRAVAVLDILAFQLDKHRFSLKSRRAKDDRIVLDQEGLIRAYTVRIVSAETGLDSIAATESR